MSLVASLVLIGIELAVPDIALYEDLTGLVRRVDFQDAVLNGMLAFLLFAGALHVDLAILRRRAWAVGSMATIGVMISTAIVGAGRGALHAKVQVPGTLEIDMAGESSTMAWAW